MSRLTSLKNKQVRTSAEIKIYKIYNMSLSPTKYSPFSQSSMSEINGLKGENIKVSNQNDFPTLSTDFICHW